MTLNRNAQILLDSFKDSIFRAMDKSGSSGRWPMPVLKTTNDACIFSEPAVAEAFYSRVKKIQSKYDSLSRVTKKLVYPSVLARLTMIFRSREIWSLNSDEQIDMYNILADILTPLYKGDKFCLKGKNILLDKGEQKFIINKLGKAKKYAISNALIAQLDGRLWLYAEMIYSRWHNIAHEFHGPYKFGKEKLLIKEWHDLQGPGWPVFKNFPYKKIVCYEFYKNNPIFIDLHNRLCSKKPLAQTITRSYIEVDGKLIGQKSILKTMATIDKFLGKGEKFLGTRNKTQLKIINATMEFYCIKILADILNVDWEPPKILLDNIKKNKLPKESKKLLSKLTYYYPRLNKKNINIVFNPLVKF